MSLPDKDQNNEEPSLERTHGLIYKCRFCGMQFTVAAPEFYVKEYSELFTKNFYPEKNFSPALGPRVSGRYIHPHGDGGFGIGDLIGARRLTVRERREMGFLPPVAKRASQKKRGTKKPEEPRK